MQPTVLLYDWDNTLVDGWAGIAAALNAVFDAFTRPAIRASGCRVRRGWVAPAPDLAGRQCPCRRSA